MEIIVLNGSPRPSGNTAAMIEAYKSGAESAGHHVTVFDLCRMNVKGCLACEYCHTKAFRQCVQKDDMQKIYPVLDEADMIVLASPVYYHGFSGQLQCAVNRIYAPGYPKKLRKAALLLSSGSTGVYDGAVYEYRNSFLSWLHLEDMGIFSAAGKENKSEELLSRLKNAGAALRDPDDHNIALLAITFENLTVRALLNNTVAARDFMNRLPLNLSVHRTENGFGCEVKDIMSDESEMRKEWTAGDISLTDGFLELITDEQPSTASRMIIAHLSARDTQLFRDLPSQAEFRLSLEEPYR